MKCYEFFFNITNSQKYCCHRKNQSREAHHLERLFSANLICATLYQEMADSIGYGNTSGTQQYPAVTLQIWASELAMAPAKLL